MSRCSSASGSRRSQRETCVACPAIEIKCAKFEVIEISRSLWTVRLDTEQRTRVFGLQLFVQPLEESCSIAWAPRQAVCDWMSEALLRLPRTTGYPHTQQYVVECGTSAESRHRCYPPLAGRKLAFEWLCGSLVYLPVTLNFTQVLSFDFFKACLLVNPALIARADENSALSFFADVCACRAPLVSVWRFL